MNEALAEEEFGGKAVNLAKALRAGLTVPPGYALSFEWVEAVQRNDDTVLAHLASAFAQMKLPIAVRSSAVGEDSKGASFAGQHLSVLNVTTFPHLKSAISEVVQSALTPSAQSYREKLGVEGATPMGVVLQELHHSEAAGVMFTRNPINGTEERVIEAAWGLGEVVVAGLVIPDYYRLSPEVKYWSEGSEKKTSSCACSVKVEQRKSRFSLSGRMRGYSMTLICRISTNWRFDANRFMASSWTSSGDWLKALWYCCSVAPSPRLNHKGNRAIEFRRCRKPARPIYRRDCPGCRVNTTQLHHDRSRLAGDRRKLSG